MSFLFKSKSKTPHDIIKSFKETMIKYLHHIEEKKGGEKQLEELSRLLASMKMILIGDHETEPSPELITQLSQEIYAYDILVLLTAHLAKFEFEVIFLKRMYLF